MWIVYLFYLSMLLPAFSFSQVLAGIYFQNRILWIPIGILYFINIQRFKVSKLSEPFIILSLLFLSYTIFGIVLDWNFMMYMGYFLTSLLLVMTIPIVRVYPSLYIKFFKFFFWCNLIYVVWQTVCVNVGLISLSMLQSNLPAQSEAGYHLPYFVSPPFIRYSGLFNESSPFTVYLIICFCFFRTLGKRYKTYKVLSFLLILFGGAKIGYLFLIAYAVFFIKSKIIRIIALGVLVLVIGIILVNFDLLMELTSGEAMSLMSRMSSLENTTDDGLSLFGVGLKTSSNGDVGLDMFSILSSGFGIIGSSIILSCIIWFYHQINYNDKRRMILPFVLGALGSGSLMILQYSLMAYCLAYLHAPERHTKIKVAHSV